MKWFALSVVFLGVVQNGSSLNEGEGCVIRHTDSAGVCTLGSKCLPALNDYQRNGIPPTLCSEQRFPFLVCCTDLTANNQKPVFEKTTRRKRLSERKCDEYSRYMPENTPNCIDDQVIEKAKRGEFPHMAAVGWENYLRRTDYMFECSGSLISSRFVLTSAHCKVGPYSHKQPPKIVRLGPLDIPMQDNATDEDLPVKTIHVYPGYNSSVIYNNIALLELEADVDFNDDIRPACLWSKPDFPGYSKAIATGWVVDGINVPWDALNSLMKMPFRLLDSNFCNKTFEKYQQEWWGVSDEQLCVEKLNASYGMCTGPPGSPLQVVSRSDKCIVHVVGVLTLATWCGVHVPWPAVYTRVYSHLDWIEGVVWRGEQ